ncbi:MAG: histidine kinase [Acidimicrobiia bacterium]|nr:histidine kinase [Acidimicrobiia bacterium]RZV42663.1 MAG: histidine kinase [Acidimicrobiia bacterium]
MATRETSLPVDRTLRQIIVGFRYVGAVWISVIGVIAIVEWDASPVVVLSTLAIAWGWAIATGLSPRHVIRGWPFLLTDLAIGSWTAIAPALTGTDDGGTFSGGYPFSTVLVWAYAFGIPGGAISGLIVSVVGLSQDQNVFTTNLTNALIYIAGGGVAGWGFSMLRRSEERRLEVEGLLANERAERIRSEERAEVAAHLHDSVLQTLALIQKRSSEPAEVGSLARGQERELRNWLYGAANLNADTLAGALEEVCADIEDRQRVEVELVTVGDCPLDSHSGALVAATREAITNAAKFSGAKKVSVYGELGDSDISVFIRDRGTGFDPDSIPEDRQGVRESIIGRMRRHGGDAIIRTSPGGGTEVELTVTREAT